MVTTMSRTVGAREMTFEAGKLAKLADGAVVVTYGQTQVLATCVRSNPREGIDFFPLTIDVEERAYAAGKIPGSFFRREGRPGETAILTARLIDRPLRPTFKEGFRDEVQVVVTVLSVDGENPYDIPAMNAAGVRRRARRACRSTGRSPRAARARSAASGRSTRPSRRSRTPRSTSSSRARRTTRAASTS